MEDDDRISIRRRLPEPLLGVGELTRPDPARLMAPRTTELSPRRGAPATNTSAPLSPTDVRRRGTTV